MKRFKLFLEDSSEYQGFSFGTEKSVSGEVVFNTGMVGYYESLTDPSYKGQILVFTYPLIGNYGVPGNEAEGTLTRHFESDRIHVSAIIVSDYSFFHNHWNAEKSLSQWLIEYKIPALYGIDTRALTKRLREKGTMLGKIVFDKDASKTTSRLSGYVLEIRLLPWPQVIYKNFFFSLATKSSILCTIFAC